MDDIQLNEAFDFEISNGDLDVGESTLQNQRLLLVAQKGEFKQHPKTGVGIESYLNAENPQDMLLEIRSQFELDGMKVESLKQTSTGEINVIAHYNED